MRKSALALAFAGAGCGLITGIDVATPPPATADAPAAGFSLVAQDERAVALSDLLAEGHVVLVFYRGHW